MNDYRNVVGQLYDAAVDSTTWPSAMNALVRQCGGFGAIAFSIEEPGQAIPMTESLNDIFQSYIRDGWHLRDDRFRGVPLLKTKGIFVDLDFATVDELNGYPFYQEFLAAYQLRWGAVIGLKVENKLWALSIQRTTKQGPFDAAEQAQLGRLAPHLSRAVTLYFAIERARSQGMLDAMEAIHCAAFLVYANGHVSRMNRLAERLIGNGLVILQGQLIAEIHAETQQLHALIHSAVTARNELAASPKYVVLKRQGQHSLIARVIPIRRNAGQFFAGDGALVLIADPGSTPPAAADVISQIHGLTPAEGRMAICLAGGKSISECADELGSALGTARQLTKQVLSKTGTHRQSQLIALIHSHGNMK